MVCTGGTTGRPKAVLWRQGDIYVSAMAGAEGATAESIAAGADGWGAGGRGTPRLRSCTPPRSGRRSAGSTSAPPSSCTTTRRPSTPRRCSPWPSASGPSSCRSSATPTPGPLVDELRRHRYDLSALLTIGTGGAATGEQHKAALVELLPHVTIRDGYGASETGGMAFGARTRQERATASSRAGGGVVTSADRTRFLEPGDDEVGWVARRGRVPLGYLGDREKTEATFPIVDGERVAIPGDRGRLLADGSIALLGRDSMVVNTRRREGLRRGGRGRPPRATPTSPTPSWSAGRRSASARRWSPWSRRATGATRRPADAPRVRRRRASPASRHPRGGGVRRGAAPRQRQGRLRGGEEAAPPPSTPPAAGRPDVRARVRGPRSARRGARRPAWCRARRAP